MPRHPLKDIGPELDLLIEAMAIAAGISIEIDDKLRLTVLNLLADAFGAKATNNDLVARSHQGKVLANIYTGNLVAVGSYFLYAFFAARHPRVMAQYTHPMAVVGAVGPVAAVGHDIVQRKERRAQLQQPEVLDIRAAKKLARALVEIVEDMDDDDATKFAKLVDLFGIDIPREAMPRYDLATTVEYGAKAVLFNAAFDAENGVTNSAINFSTTLLLHHKLLNDVADRLRAHPVFEGIRTVSNSLFLFQLGQILAYRFNDGEIDSEEASWLQATGTMMGCSTMAMLVAAQRCQPVDRTRSRVLRGISTLNDAVDDSARFLLGTAGTAASYVVQQAIAGAQSAGEFGYSTYACLLESVGLGQGDRDSTSSTSSPLAEQQEQEAQQPAQVEEFRSTAVAPAPEEKGSDQGSNRSQSQASIESDGFQLGAFTAAAKRITDGIKSVRRGDGSLRQSISQSEIIDVIDLARSAIDEFGLKLMQHAERWADPVDPESLGRRTQDGDSVESDTHVQEMDDDANNDSSPLSSAGLDS